MHTYFKLLKQINNSPGINQRTLSKTCNISLGKVNRLIEELKYNNYIDKKDRGRKHRYFITLLGLHYLEKNLKAQQDERIQLSPQSITLSSAVILAAGKNDLFDFPLALCPIENTYLINRTISQLKKQGIHHIIVVIGYMGNLIKNHLDSSVICVENPNYNWTSTMASLACTAPYLKNDFILIEGDLVIEDLGIKNLIDTPQSDCILISTESGSGDEAFVEIQVNVF